MSGPHPLTQGAVEQLLLNRSSSEMPTLQPVLQVIEVKDVKSNGTEGQRRTKVQLSDGVHFIAGLLTHTAGPPQNLLWSAILLQQWMVQTLNSGPEKSAKSPVVTIIMRFVTTADLGSRVGTPVDIRTTQPGRDAVARLSNPNGQGAAATQGQAPPGHMSAGPSAHDPYAGQHPAAANGYQAQAIGAPQHMPSTNAYVQPPQQAYGQPPQQAYGQPPAQGYGQPPAQAYGNPMANQQAPGMYGQPGGGQYQQPGAVGAYGAPQAAAYGAPPAQYQNRGVTARNANPANYTPIKNVSTFINRFTIKGRCSSKGEKRYYNRNGKQGCVFNFDLVDDTGEIRVVAFTEVAEKFFDSVSEGKCYTLSKATAKLMDNSKRKWNQTGHDCEIYLQNDSLLEEVNDDPAAAAIPRIMVKPVKLATIESTEAGSIVDVIGIIESCKDWAPINRRDGSETKKRSMTIKDDSGASIELTVWGDKAEGGVGAEAYNAVSQGRHPVLVGKAMKIGDFQGKTLSTTGGSTFLLDADDVPGVAELRQWFNTGGANQITQPLSVAGRGGRADRRVTLGVIQDEGLGSIEGQPAWVKVGAMLHEVVTSGENIAYPACQADFEGRTCSKKMQEQEDGTFYCERCAQVGEPKWRYIMKVNMSDFTHALSDVSVFGETGETIMGGVSAEDARAMMQQQNDNDWVRHLDSLSFRLMNFKLKCALDTFRDGGQVKYTVQSCEPIDYCEDSKAYIAMIEDVMAGRPIACMQVPGGAQGSTAVGMGAGAAPAMAQPGMSYGAAAPGMVNYGQQQAGYGAGMMPLQQQPMGMAAPGAYGMPPQQGYGGGGHMGYQQAQHHGGAMQGQPGQGALAFL